MWGTSGIKAAKATAFYNKATIAGKIFQMLSSNGVTSENKTIHTPPLPHPLCSKLGCFLFAAGSLNSGTTSRGGGGVGKALFSSFGVGKKPESTIQVNFGENIRQLKILGSCPGDRSIHGDHCIQGRSRYRFDCIELSFRER